MLRDSVSPTGPEPSCKTPMSVLVRPTAVEFVAVISPSYERNSTRTPSGSTSARPSGEPFCRPAKFTTATPFETEDRIREPYWAPLDPL